MTRRVLRLFGRAQRPAAWVLLGGAVLTLVGVATDLIATGNAKAATLLVAADLLVSSLGVLAEVENEVDDGGAADE